MTDDAAPRGAAPMGDMLDAVGEVIASKMRHDSLDVYRAERALWKAGPVDREAPGYRGTYEGCMDEAESFVERLRSRGFDVVALQPVAAPPAPAPSVEAMAERLRQWMSDAGDRTYILAIASEVVRFMLTGLPPGPERDTVLAAVLARLAVTKTDAAPAPGGVAEAVRAYLAAQDARDAFMASARSIGTPEDQALEFDTLGRQVAARLVLDAALASEAAGDGPAERQITMPMVDRVRRHMLAGSEAASVVLITEVLAAAARSGLMVWGAPPATPAGEFAR